ncbi:MAG: CapA family protein [Oscillospiraceae bacterium]|nr:CapA family protein [Oscillospiraceae bacterium]
MALDPEQFRQKRIQRQAQRQAAQKRLQMRLLLAFFALVGCAVIILLATRSASPSQPGDAGAPAQTAPAGEITTIRIAAVGDVNITDRVVNSATSVQEYNNMLMDVSHLLADPHLTLMNLEGVVSGPPYGGSRSTPPELLQALKKAGVDGVQLANSYTIHGGISSLATTVAAVEAHGLLPLGTYKNDGKDKPYTIINVQGVRVALIAFTKGTVGMGMLSNGRYGTNILYTDYDTTYQKVDTERINRILSDVRSEKPDLTIAMLHWGSEFNDNISTSQKKIRTLLEEGGVDAILGTHSHYVQKMELDAQGRFIAYSLGDFLGDGTRAGSEYSVILNLTVEKNNKTGNTVIKSFDYVPTFIVNEENQPLRVLRLKEAMAAYEAGHIDRVSQTTYEAMKYALTRVEARVAGK